MCSVCCGLFVMAVAVAVVVAAAAAVAVVDGVGMTGASGSAVFSASSCSTICCD